MEKTYVTFDPRSKLCTILFASFLLMFPLPFKAEILFVSLLYSLFILNGSLKKGTIFYSIFWLLVLGDYLLFPYIDNSFAAFFDFLFVGNRRMLPTIMAAAFAMNRTRISEWIAALKKCHIPFSLIIPLTVLFRFFPTLFQDFKSIRNAMKYRGIAVSTVDLFLHPFQTMEYIIVPILMSAENTSLDLSSAALVRGLANPTTHTSIYEIRLKIQDYVLIGILVLSGIIGRLIE
ncbi:cobalt ABC transporter permease [Enterococcus ureilyticus]|uniref:Cobalt ABC transporter permease n=1 Tax=Enterococcus ureilyticus TaxID=1131292 RepID=A0A1E5HDB8_9ENTE|nr:energy-coupling factor transporter transmembrane component T [Enterococcus ureilyticus]MBM7687689.1 energy-coupling factor transport system permease protein [Enterococcus ureilyticus]OEG22795.1 cobalt ABC transporter permease [Enterococcus ureilyticus]